MQNEKEEKKKPSLLKAAALAGVGYIAYSNRNEIVSKTKNLFAKGNIKLAKSMENYKFKGKISEQTNLWSGVLETFGDPSPKNITKAFGLSAEERTKRISRTMEAKNKALRTKMKENAPSDVRNILDTLKNNAYQTKQSAKTYANLNNFKEIMKTDKYKKAFGDNLENVETVLSRNYKLFNHDPLAENLKDGKIEKVDKRYLKLFNEFNNNEKKTIDFKISNTNTKDSEKFIADMMNVVHDVNKQTSKQIKSYETTKISKDNVYGQAKALFDISTFEAERSARELKKDVLNSGFLENGFKPVTMEQARSVKVSKNEQGRWFQSDLKNAESIDLQFGTRRRSLKTDSENSLVATWYEQGAKAGIHQNVLKKDSFSNELLFNDTTGELINLSPIKEAMEKTGDFIQNNFQVPMLNMNPLDLAQRRTKLANVNKRNSYIFDPNSFLHLIDTDMNLQPHLDKRNTRAFGKRTAETYIEMDGDLIDSALSKVIGANSPEESYQKFIKNKADFTLETGLKRVSTQTGVYKEYAEIMSGRTNREIDYKENPLKRIFGLGQENESVLERTRRSFNKFDDPYYGGNVIDSIDNFSKTGYLNGFEEGIDRAYANLHGRTSTITPDTRHILADTFDELLNSHIRPTKEIKSTDGITEEGILEISKEISEKYKNKKLNINNKSMKTKIRDSLEEDISNLYEYQFKTNQEGFLGKKRFIKDRTLWGNTLQDAFGESDHGGISGSTDLFRMIQQYSIALADEEGVDLLEVISKSNSFIKEDALEEVASLRGINQLSYFNKKNKQADTPLDIVENMFDYRNYFDDKKNYKTELKYSLKKSDPFLGTGIGQKQEDLLEGNYTLIKKHQSLLETINKNLADSSLSFEGESADSLGKAVSVANGILEYGKNTGSSLFASRGGNVTNSTVVPWFFANRMDRAVQGLGLGLPNELKGSAISTMGNQWARRIALPFMAYQTAVYLDGLTGDTVSDSAANAYANMHQDINAVKELTGINHIGRSFESMFPYLDQVKAMPFIEQANFATMGIFSDFRSKEDVKEDYESGEKAVRKGRYWGIGSNTPWMGGKIERYEPNWYRKAKSDYKFSENVYGSEKEYWENNFMPTLTNPLAPIRHFITDPYHYEEKHATSRPYAVTGGFNELQQIPLIGPAVDSVVSSVFKPERTNPLLKKSHEEYLAMYNERLASAYINMNAGGVVKLGPSGSMTLSSDAFNVNFEDVIDENGMVDEEALAQNEMSYNAGRDRMAIGLMNQTGVIPSLPGGTQLPVQGGVFGIELDEESSAGIGVAGDGKIASGAMSQYLLSQMNARLTDAKTTSRSDNVATAGTLHDPNVLRDLSGAISQRSLTNKDGVIRDITYNAGEIAGMYGFLSKSAFGFEESGRGATLESSSLFNNYNRSFWDNELGGIGGDLSEIGRRFLARDPNKNYYNPIRNEMPTWLILMVM